MPRAVLLAKHAAAAPVYRSQSVAFFARLAAQPNTARKARYNTLIAALVDAGVWAKLDALYVFGAQDQATALTNLVQTSYGATATGTPTFAQDIGFVGDSAKYIDSNFNPSTAGGNYVQNSATLFVWSLTPDIGSAVAGLGSGGVGYDEIYPRYSDGNRYTALNATVESAAGASSDGSGLYSLSRVGSTGYSVYVNGASIASQTAASSALANANITFLTQGSHYYILGTVAFGGIGSNLTAGDNLALYNALLAYKAGLASDYATVRRLVGTRNDLPNFGVTVAAATANTFNVRKEGYAHAAIVDPSVVYVGYGYQSGSESNFANAITYHTAIELPDGSFHQLLKGGVADHVVSPGDLFNESDHLTGFTIPVGQYWIRTWGSIASGVFYATDYGPNSAVGDLAQQGIGLSDLTMGGAITTNMASMPMGILMGSVPTAQRAVGIVGDSIAQGVGGFVQPVSGGIGGGIGYLAGYLDGRLDYIHFGRSGLRASTTAAYAVLTNRLRFAALAGLTDIWNELGVNDVGASAHTAVVAAADIGSTNNNFARGAPNIARVYQSTITPYVTIAGAPTPATDGNQTAAAANRVVDLNTTIRAGTIANQTGYVEVALTAQNITIPDPQKWVAGYTTDGVHPTQTAGAAIVAALISANALSP